MFYCDLYNNLRQRLIPERYYVIGGEEKLHELLNSDDERVLDKVGQYILKAFKTRDEFTAS